MSPKLDVRVVFLLVVILLQVTYTTWSLVNARLSLTKGLVPKGHPPDSANIVFVESTQADRQVQGENAWRPGHGELKQLKEGKFWRSEPRRSMTSSSLKTDLYVKTPIRNDDLKYAKPVSSSHNGHGVFVSIDHKDVSSDRKTGFIINKSDACKRSTLIVIIVSSAVENTDLRSAIRRTWASHLDPEVRVLFIVGRHGNASVENRVFEEDAEHRDVIMANFDDSYVNLSLKSIEMLRWTMAYCFRAKFLVKADDDTFLNTPALLQDLRKNIHRRFIMGNIIALAKPVRDSTSKWYTPVSVFNRTSYPTYVSGMAYVISVDAIRDLYSARLRVPVFWLEDVYVTGILAGVAGVKLIFNGKFDGFRDLQDVCLIRSHIVRHRVSSEEMQTLWTIVHNADHGDCL